MYRSYSAALKKRESQWTVPRPTPPRVRPFHPRIFSIQSPFQLNGGAMSPKPASQALDKSRSTQPNGSAVHVTPDTRRDISTVAGVPAAPRAQSSNGVPQITDERPSTPASLAKLAIERYIQTIIGINPGSKRNATQLAFPDPRR